MTFHVVIPARYGSTRLPGKPLIDLAGKPMIQRVAERAAESAARSIVVATDDGRVCAAVAAFGGEAQMTDAGHESGSDRVMEVAQRRGWRDEEIVVNVQGDEPLLPPAVIDQVAAALDGDHGCHVATLCEPIRDGAALRDPNVVKVATAINGRALMFSRAPLPWAREAFQNGVPDVLPAALWRRHVGIYAYRVAALREFVSWQPSALERTESLEQLRLLEHGRGIVVREAAAAVPGGVDTLADAERVRTLLSRPSRVPPSS